MKIKVALMLLAISVPFCVFGAQAVNKAEPPKPMKLFVEIDGRLYEAVIDKKGVPRPKELADAKVQEKFRSEAKRFGLAYLQNRILLEKKLVDKAGQ